MREILFRGKRVDNGEWIEGSLIHQTKFYGDPVDCYHILYDGEFHADYYGSVEVIPETIGEFTGMLDKNGKKIFEGDIVILFEYVKKTFDVDDGEVRYGRGGFHVKEFSTLNSLNALASYDGVFRGEIIGNIHDNPELLEVKK